jgi:hypothetical protein
MLHLQDRPEHRVRDDVLWTLAHDGFEGRACVTKPSAAHVEAGERAERVQILRVDFNQLPQCLFFVVDIAFRRISRRHRREQTWIVRRLLELARNERARCRRILARVEHHPRLTCLGVGRIELEGAVEFLSSVLRILRCHRDPAEEDMNF